jgi:hypothetical protein
MPDAVQVRGVPKCFQLVRMRNGGAEGIRTLDPHVANVVLSQLSYCPTEPWWDGDHTWGPPRAATVGGAWSRAGRGGRGDDRDRAAYGATALQAEVSPLSKPSAKMVCTGGFHSAMPSRPSSSTKV